MHDAAGQAQRVAYVLEKPYHRAVFVEGELRRESEIESLGSSKQLGLGHEHEAELGKDENAQPQSPGAKHALVGDGHDQASLDLDLPARSDGPDGCVNSYNSDDVVIHVGE